MKAMMAGFQDELLKLALDTTPNQPVMLDQATFGGTMNALHQGTSVKNLLARHLGHVAPRVGAQSPRTTPPQQLRHPSNV